MTVKLLPVEKTNEKQKTIVVIILNPYCVIISWTIGGTSFCKLSSFFDEGEDHDAYRGMLSVAIS